MKTWSLSVKLLSVTLSLIALLAIIMVGRSYQGIQGLSTELSVLSEQNMKAAVVHRLEAETGAYGEQIRGYINSAFRLPLSLADMIRLSINSEDPLTRNQVHALVGNSLLSNQDISAVYAHFEPNGFDGRDRDFVNRGLDHSTESQGTLESYWIRDEQGRVVPIPVDDPEEKYFATKDEFGVRESEWYLCSHDTKAPCLVEPHFYEISAGYEEIMTALIAPVVVNGQFRGIVGADLNLPLFQTLVEDLSRSLYDGAAKVTLLSDRGLIVAGSHVKNHIRERLIDVDKVQGQVLSKLHQQAKVLFTDESIYVSTALGIPAAQAQWALLIELPLQVALADLIKQQEIAASKSTNVVVSQLVIGVLIALVALALIVALVHSITRPLRQLNQQVDQLASADGDLSQMLHLDTHAELIQLGGSFNSFLVKLRDLINALKQVGQQVRTEALENLAISKQTDQATVSQQSEIDSVVTATQEMSATAMEVARIAADVSESSNAIHQTITSSQKELNQAVDNSLELSENMDLANESIHHVATRSEAITSILTVIGGIAEQTNLLALNAAIEAARAGEQGRGFAVVADEVRTLASRTQESTGEINTLIHDLQEEVKQAVQRVETGREQAIQNMNLTQEAHASLEQVVAEISSIADHIRQVATAAEEQSSVSEDITKNLTVIGDAARMLAELAQQANLSSQAVTQQLDEFDVQISALRTE